MNRRFSFVAAIVACVSVFCVSLGGTLANWSVVQDSVGRLTLGLVEGEIIEEYEQGQTVMPGEAVPKIVNIKNTGNVDSVIRVSLGKSWHGGELDSDAIRITCNNGMWQYNPDDGFYYYKGVLKPGEITAKALMESFTVDGSADGEYKGADGEIDIHLECLQAGGNGISAWGMTFEELGIDYNPDAPEVPTIYVGFNDPDTGFEFDAYKGDLFMNFKELVPGEERSEVLRVENKYSETAEIFLRAEVSEEIYSDTDKTELIEKLLGEYAVISIVREDGTVIYKGPVWTQDGDSFSMRNNLSLGVFPNNTDENYTVKLELSGEMDNSYRELLGSVKWIFSANGREQQYVPDIPDMGDSLVPVSVCAVLMMLSGTALVILIIKRPKRNNNEE